MKKALLKVQTLGGLWLCIYSISIDTIIPHGRKEACMRSKVSKVSKVLLLAQRAYNIIILLYTEREEKVTGQ